MSNIFSSTVEKAKIQPSSDSKNNSLTTNQESTISKQYVDIKKNDSYIHSIKLILKTPDKDSTTYDISNYIKAINIEKNFEIGFKPIYTLLLKLPIEIYQIMNVFKNYKLELTINTLSSTPNPIDKDLNTQQLSSEMVLSVSANLISFNNMPDTYNELYEKNLNGELNEKDILIDYKSSYFEQRHIKTGYAINSANYRNQNMQNILFDLLNKFKENSLKNINNLIFCKPDFTDNIPNITIPPLCLRDSLEYLQKNYNIYNRKPIFYIDGDILYVIKRGYNPPLKNEDRDIVNVIIAKLLTSNSETENYINEIKKNSNKVYISGTDTRIVNNYSSAISDIGNKVIIKSDSDPTGLKSSCIGIKDSSSIFQSMNNDGQIINEEYSGKEKFINDNTSSRASLNLLVDEAQAEGFILELLLENINLSYFKPTTLLNIYYSDSDKSQYNGLYYIRSMQTNFEISGNNDINCITHFILGRKYNDDGSISK